MRFAFAAQAAGGAPIMMDAASEFAVSAFLGGRARYPAIAATSARMQDRIAATDVEAIGAALAIDARVRREAYAMLGPPRTSTGEALAD